MHVQLHEDLEHTLSSRLSTRRCDAAYCSIVCLRGADSSYLDVHPTPCTGAYEQDRDVQPTAKQARVKLGLLHVICSR